MAVKTQPVNVDEFDTFIQLPENSERRLEYIMGEIVEVPSNPYVSEIAGLLIFFLHLFLREHGITGHVTGEGGGYMVAGERYAPDVAYISLAKQLTLVRKGYNPNPPDLAIEIISDPNNRREQDTLRVKITNYLSVGVLVWVVDAEQRRVEVHRVGEPVLIVNEDATLDGGDVLPNFRLAVKDILPN